MVLPSEPSHVIEISSWEAAEGAFITWSAFPSQASHRVWYGSRQHASLTNSAEGLTKDLYIGTVRVPSVVDARWVGVVFDGPGVAGPSFLVDGWPAP